MCLPPAPQRKIKEHGTKFGSKAYASLNAFHKSLSIYIISTVMHGFSDKEIFNRNIYLMNLGITINCLSEP